MSATRSIKKTYKYGKESMKCDVNRLVAEYNDKTQSPNEGDQKVFAKDRWIDAKEWEIENLNDTEKEFINLYQLSDEFVKSELFKIAFERYLEHLKLVSI